MKKLSNQATTLTPTPEDVRTCNYRIEGGNIIIESISDYLARVNIALRTPGVIITILYLDENQPTIAFPIEQFDTILGDYYTRYFVFESGLADADFVELVMSGVSQVDELLAGTIDGTNRIFTTTFSYRLHKIMIFLNGKKTREFIEISDTEIEMNVAPLATHIMDEVEAVYIRK